MKSLIFMTALVVLMGATNLCMAESDANTKINFVFKDMVPAQQPCPTLDCNTCGPKCDLCDPKCDSCGPKCEVCPPEVIQCPSLALTGQQMFRYILQDYKLAYDLRPKNDSNLPPNSDEAEPYLDVCDDCLDPDYGLCGPNSERYDRSACASCKPIAYLSGCCGNTPCI